MSVAELLELLDRISPFETQEKWDSSGLNVGDPSMVIGDIYVSLDIDMELMGLLPERSVLIVHHPLIFKPLGAINPSLFPGSIIKEALKKEIAIISMHTNFDKSHLNMDFVKNRLKFKPKSEGGLVIEAYVNLEFDALLEHLKYMLGGTIRYNRECDYIKSAAFVCGAGASMLEHITSDVLITGDVKYHDMVAARSSKKSLIDVGHYESENNFAHIVERELQNFGLKAIIADFKNPYEYF